MATAIQRPVFFFSRSVCKALCDEPEVIGSLLTCCGKKSKNKIRKYSILIAKHIARKTHKYDNL